LEERFPETKAAIGAARAGLDALVRRAEKRGLQVREFLSFKDTLSELLQHISSLEHDLIVMGAHGAYPGTDPLFIGSSARKVVRHANAPVLVVKEKVEAEALRTILYASDMGPGADVQMGPVLQLAAVLDAKIQLLYVNTPMAFEESPYILDRTQALLDQCPEGTTMAVHNALNVERGILQFAERNTIDLIAMNTEGRTGAFRLISHSIAEAVVNGASVPVLTIKHNNQ
jgi:nucleotide-binding universal stress UspA family protein